MLFDFMIPPDALATISQADLDLLRAELGLDDPFLVRYGTWIAQVVKGDFGYSLQSGVSVRDLLAQKLPATIELSLAALVISTLLGSLLGVVSALNKGRFGDHVLTVAGMIGVCYPAVFFSVWSMIVLVVFQMELLPVGGRMTPGNEGVLPEARSSDTAGHSPRPIHDCRSHALFTGKYARFIEQGVHQDSEKQGNSRMAGQPHPRASGRHDPGGSTHRFPSSHTHRRICPSLSRCSSGQGWDRCLLQPYEARIHR